MEKKLKLIKFKLYHGKTVEGKNENMTGDCSDLWGDCSNLCGDCTGLSGDCSGLIGDCTGLKGDLDECCLSVEELLDGVNIRDLVEE